jgi:hypothetical protein
MRVLNVTIALWVAGIALVASAEEEEWVVKPQSPEAETAPAVGLDQLLRLPNSYEADVDRRGGATASEWRARFDQTRKDLLAAQKRLVEAESELQEISSTSSGWAVAAPGASDPQASPLSLRLREEVRTQRTQIEEAGREIRALDVEADLAAVPPEWRE